jgi:hypothetical protein
MVINDIVQLSNGSKLILVAIKNRRPKYPYVGVLVNGGRTAYKFGPINRPQVVGHADDNHPALVTYRSRQQGGVDNKGIILQLLQAVEREDMTAAKILAGAARTMECWKQ